MGKWAVFVVAALMLWAHPATAQQAASEDRPTADEIAGVDDILDERSDCDRFIEDYTRSSGRKLWRSLNRGNWNYNLEVVPFSEPVEVNRVGEDEKSIRFELFREADGRIVGAVDRQREWEYTYLIAFSSIGPIIISQTWQPRHLRDSGQACEPIASAVEWPISSAPSVDIEPFRYWGLRVSWRIPPVDRAEPVEQTPTEVLRRVIWGHDNGEHRR